jgi:FtsX-like permease family
VIGLGLRLALAGGREALVRLVVIAAAVALGVGLLLTVLAGANAVRVENSRYAWLYSYTTPGTGAADPTWWHLRADFFDGQEIGRVDVAGTGPDSPVPPGLPRLPGPGEYYASPAMAALLASTPADELADRYPGRLVGTIGRAALPDPTVLVIVVGHHPDELSRQPGAYRVTRISTVTPGHAVDAIDLILSVVAAGLLFPVLIFISTATRLTAARREQRFAAIRLIGATPRQISVIAAVEATLAAVTGTAVGFALFLALRDPLARIPFTGAPFFPRDMALNPADVLGVGLGVPVGAALAARLALRRVRISPLGVTRRVTPGAPRWYRLVPLVAGIAELAYFIGRRPSTSNGQMAAFLPGILLVMLGLIAAGPWLTMTGSRVLADRARRPATLLAARRLADDPKAGFRAVSGLVLALFVTSVAVGVITTIDANRGVHRNGEATTSTLYQGFWPDPAAPAPPTAVPGPVSARLLAAPGVATMTVVRRNPNASSRPGPLPGLVSCADLARTPAFGRCTAGATVAEVWPDFSGPGDTRGAATVWRAAPVSPGQLAGLPLLSVVVRTDGSPAAVERARSILEAWYPDFRIAPLTGADSASRTRKTLAGWQQLAGVVILASLVIAGCSLAVNVAGGLNDRKRAFSLLRLGGVPVRVLRRVVALESGVPLLATAAAAIGFGLLAAHLFLRAQMEYSLRPPPISYYLVVIAGLGTSLGIIASTFPMLERMTGPETARNE